MNDIIIFVPFTEMNAFALILASSKFTHVHFLPQSRGLSTLLFMTFIHASFHFFYHNPIYFPSLDPLVNDGKNCRATLIIEQDLTRVRDLEIKLANLVDITCLFRPFFVQLVREIPRVAEAINFIRGPEVLLLLIFRISYSERKWSIAFFLRLQITYLMLIWPWKEREGGNRKQVQASMYSWNWTVLHLLWATAFLLAHPVRIRPIDDRVCVHKMDRMLHSPFWFSASILWHRYLVFTLLRPKTALFRFLASRPATLFFGGRLEDILFD